MIGQDAPSFVVAHGDRGQVSVESAARSKWA